MNREKCTKAIAKILSMTEEVSIDGSISRKFKATYKALIANTLKNTSYSVVKWKNSKECLCCYVEDSYTGRLFCLMIPDVSVDRESWMTGIRYMTVGKVGENPDSPVNVCDYRHLVHKLDCLNVFYSRGVSAMA